MTTVKDVIGVIRAELIAESPEIEYEIRSAINGDFEQEVTAWVRSIKRSGRGCKNAKEWKKLIRDVAEDRVYNLCAAIDYLKSELESYADYRERTTV